MNKRQHHKGKKRPKNWHRGKNEGRRAQRALDQLPDTGVGPQPPAAPRPLPRGAGAHQRNHGGHGDTL